MSSAIVFYVFAPQFNPNVGGHVVLHKLCDLINRQGTPCFLVPLFESNDISVIDWQTKLRQTLANLNQYENIRNNPDKFYPRNPNYNTPLFQGNINDIANLKNAVVIYPEITNGNPLNAKNVARWLLHTPGFHSGKINLIKGEVHFKYSDAFEPVKSPFIELAPIKLNILDIPWSIYENKDPENERFGTAFAIRKGKGRRIIHDLSDSVCIDGKSHQEISEIFKRVTTFISYDPDTMFLPLAVIAGANAVIIPNETSEMAQGSNAVSHYGIANGFDDMPRAIATREQLVQNLKIKEADSYNNVVEFIKFWEKRLIS